MRPIDIREAQRLLEASRWNAGRRTPMTIEQSIAASVAQMTDSDLRALARKAHRRGYAWVLRLVHAEFLLRRPPRLLAAA